jgi:hypothetical protein
MKNNHIYQLCGNTNNEETLFRAELVRPKFQTEMMEVKVDMKNSKEKRQILKS